MGYLAGAIQGFTGGMKKDKETEKDGGNDKTGIIKRIMDKTMDHRKRKQAMTAAEESFPTFKRGGRVKKTGLAKVHKGERVLTKRQAQKYRSRSKGKTR